MFQKSIFDRLEFIKIHIKMKLRSDLVLRHFGEEHVIIDPGQDIQDMSKLYTLNNTAAFLWQNLQGMEFSVETVFDMLMLHYEVDASEALEDARHLVRDFEKHGLLN